MGARRRGPTATGFERQFRGDGPVRAQTGDRLLLILGNHCHPWAGGRSPRAGRVVVVATPHRTVALDGRNQVLQSRLLDLELSVQPQAERDWGPSRIGDTTDHQNNGLVAQDLDRPGHTEQSRVIVSVVGELDLGPRTRTDERVGRIEGRERDRPRCGRADLRGRIALHGNRPPVLEDGRLGEGHPCELESPRLVGHRLDLPGHLRVRQEPQESVLLEPAVLGAEALQQRK